MSRKRLTALAIALLSFMGTKAFAQNAVTKGENCVLTREYVEDQNKLVVKINDSSAYEVTTRSTPDTVKLFFTLRNFQENILKMYGVKWFKATLLSAISDEHDTFEIKTYYDSNSAFQFASRNLYFFRSKNQEIVKSVLNVDFIGMSEEDLVSYFGEGVRTTAGYGYRYMHNLKDIMAYVTDEKLYFYTVNGVVTEVAYERSEDSNISFAMKSFWGYNPVSEGWLTKGDVTSANVNVRASIPNGPVVGQVGGEEYENQVMISEIATNGQEYNWVKILTKSGLSGWVYGKYIRPGVLGTSYQECLNNSIEYFNWIATSLKEPESVAEIKDIKGNLIRKLKDYGNYKIEYALTGYNNDIEEFASIEYISPGPTFNDRFCGLGIGDSLEAANTFAEGMLRADAVPFNHSQYFSENSELRWLTVDHKAEIIVRTTNGAVSSVIIRKRDLFD